MTITHDHHAHTPRPEPDPTFTLPPRWEKDDQQVIIDQADMHNGFLLMSPELVAKLLEQAGWKPRT
jgi:hypothetical protein